MSTYRVKIGCCNCCAVREYDVERGTAHIEADLICPNCGCCPTESDYTLIKEEKLYGKAKMEKDQ